MRIAIVAIMITLAGAVAAYRYICHSTKEAIKDFVHFGVDAIDKAARPLADIECALHYEATDKTFSVKRRDSSFEPANIKIQICMTLFWDLYRNL